ncbi:hypothetical protein NW759_012540 [Fusarium solani]|nr:hypothetical protein NW759_012540 [Fusarium solani]
MPRLSHDESDSGRSDVTQTPHGTPSTIQYTLPTIMPIFGFIECNASFSHLISWNSRAEEPEAKRKRPRLRPPLDRLLFFAETSNLPRCLLFSSEKGTYSESSGLLVVMYSNQWRNYSLVIASREANAAPISPSAGSRGFSGAPSERVPACVAQPPAHPHI